MIRSLVAAPLGAVLLLCTAIATAPSPAIGQERSATGARQKITRADELPRRSYPLPVLPSELYTLPRERLLPLLAAIERDQTAELARFEITDRSTLDGYSQRAISIAMLRGNYAAVPGLVRALRARQEKPAAAATAAQLTEFAAAARAHGGALDEQRRVFRERFAAHIDAQKFDVVAATLRAQKGALEINNPVVTVANAQARLDTAARNADMTLDRDAVAGVLQQRVFIDHVLPFRDEAVAVLAAWLQRHETPIADTWTPRTFALRPDAPAKPVVVAIWDSGVDPALFPMATPPGIAFDVEDRQVPELLVPPQEFPLPWEQLRPFVRGARDVQGNIDSPAASAYRRQIAGLKAEEVKTFTESMRLAGQYMHGTHVAGIAVAGNPFARVFAARVTFNWRNEPLLPTEERRARDRAATRAIVAAIRASGARVVNMSWGGTQRGIEDALQYHGVGKTPEERRALARQWFVENRDVLREALASAPDILFVTTAGNRDGDSGFEEAIPADIMLPNMMTIGAVDSAGNETSFTSFGRSVVAHANGFRVESFVPGGERLVASGTSMAAPQVTNLAAKLWALYPDLTVAQVRQLILDGAEKTGRVNLIHPRRTLELAAKLKGGASANLAVVAAQ